ncbi:MAG: MotA/TolQ/ExbB proton channel family protein [Gemmatimonadota bacterium]
MGTATVLSTTATAWLQAAGGGATGSSPWDLVLQATLPTQIILLVLVVFSLLSWILIFWKWSEFRDLEESGDRFVDNMERAAGLADMRDRLRQMEGSPYTRTFEEGIDFFLDLRPRALSDEPVESEGLTPAQLDTLRLVLDKGLAEERDDLGHGLSWLAIIGSVSPLLGLLGTVVGVMNSFINITARGSASIAAVAPGIAEALISTVVGLAVAIPAVIAYNHFASKLGLFASELEGFASEFVGTLAREGRV